MLLSEAISHCGQVLKRHDYQTYVCSMYLPETAKNLKWALGSMHVETGKIKCSASNAGLADIKMQYWKDSISQRDSSNRSIFVINSMMPASSSKTLSFRLQQYITARAEDLEKTAYFSVSEVEEYSERTHSNMLYLLLEHLKISTLEADHIASHVGKAQGLISFLKAAFPLSRYGFDTGLPMDLLGQSKISQEDLKASDLEVWKSTGVRDVAHQIADTAHSHIEKSIEHLLKIKTDNLLLNRLFLSLIPAQRYLLSLQQVDFDLSSRELYQTKSDRWLPLLLAWKLWSQKDIFK